jgi:O-antigen/teichoic acid export membrane protein
LTRLLRNKNIANSIWNIADIFLYPILFFGSTSFFIHKLGTEQYGIWMLINTIVISMQVFNFGIGSNVFKSVALHTGQYNRKGKLDAVNNSLSITLLLFGVCIIIAAIASYLVRYHNMLNVDVSFKALSAKGIIMAGFIVGFKFFEQVFTNYFKALEQFQKAAFIASGNKITALVLNILLLHFLHLNVLHLLATIITVNLAFMCFALFLLNQNLKPFSFKFNLKLPKQEAHFALFTWLQSLAIIITFQTDRYLVVNYYGLSVLSYYALTATIFNHLHMGFSAIFPWLAPKLTKLYARNIDATELYIAARNLVAICSSLLLLALYIAYPFVFKIMLGANTAAAVNEYVRYFIIFELFFVLGIVPTYYFNAVGHEKKYLYFTIFFAITSLLSMCFFLWLYNKPIAVLYGLVFACIIGILVQYILLYSIMNHKFNLSKPLLILVPAVLVTLFILAPNTLIKWTSLVALLPALYFIYIRGNQNKFRLLIRS